MGAGLGGFVDGIVLHQILQWHNMLSAKLPPSNLVDVKINMFWDGVFHAAVWLMTIIGLSLLWRASLRRDVLWSGRVLVGGLFLGWGLFNLVEGVINHQILNLHHVHEYAEPRWAGDVGFLSMGGILVGGGYSLARSANRDDRD